MKEMYLAWNEWWIDLWFDYPLLFVAVIMAAIALAWFRSSSRRKF